MAWQSAAPGPARRLPVELGTVHQIPIGLGAGETDVVQSTFDDIMANHAPPPEEVSLREAGNAIAAFEAPVSAEADSPPQEDRLWDARHASEATFLIASAAGGRQSFAVLQADVSMLYRIGLDDASALRAVYGVHDPETLFRSVASRLIERYLARVSLADALGGDRARIERELLAEVRKVLEGLDCGIDAVAVVVEALHPPPEAAAAYHRVQAAEIMAAVNVATARSNAVTALQAARSSASTAQAAAVATAADTVVTARIDALSFHADDTGWRVGPDAFTFERYLARLTKGLAHARLLVVDSRLGAEATSLLDLRDAASSMAGPEGFDMPTPPLIPDEEN